MKEVGGLIVLEFSRDSVARDFVARDSVARDLIASTFLLYHPQGYLIVQNAC